MKYSTWRSDTGDQRRRTAFCLLTTIFAAASWQGASCVGDTPAPSALSAPTPKNAPTPKVEQSPHLALQQGHSGHITTLAIAPDGKSVATGGEDNTVKVWNLSSGELIHTLAEHRSNIGLVAFSHDSKKLVTGEGHWRSWGDRGSGTVHFWDMGTGQLLRTLRGPGHVKALAISPDWKIIARAGEQWTYDESTRSGKRLVTLWDAQTGRLLRTIQSSSHRIDRERVDTLVFSLDGKTVAGAGWDSAVHLWDVPSGRLRRTLPRQGGYQSVAFSPDGKTVASAMRRNGKPYYEVRLWDIPTGALRRILSGPGSQNGSLAFSRDGRTLVSGDYGRVSIWNLRNGKQERALTLHSEAGSLVALSPDGTQVVGVGRRASTAGSIGESDSESVALTIWQRRTGQLLWTVANRSLYKTPLHVALHRDGRTLIVRQSDGTTLLWDCATVKLQRTFESRDGSRPVALSRDGKILVRSVRVNRWQSAWQVWKADTGTWQRTLPVPGGGYAAPSGGFFSHDGQKLVVTSSSDVVGSGGVTLWDLPTGKALPGFSKEHSQVISVAFSPDDKLLALGHADQTISLWDVQSGAPIGRLSNPDQQVKAKDLASDKAVKDQDGSMSAVAFAPDGNTLASGDDKGRIRLWNVQGKAALRTWAGLTEGIETLAFSPDGQRLASGGKDHALKMWDAPSGSLQSALAGHDDAITSAFFLSNANTLVSASRDGTVRFWNRERGQLVATLLPLSARSLSTRSLSPTPDATLPVQWIAMTPGGYYSGSKDVDRFIRWRVGSQAWPAEKYESLFHRPDRVEEEISGQSLLPGSVQQQ